MRRWVAILALVCLLFALGYVVSAQYSASMRLGGQPSRVEAPWQTEEQWLVDAIARDLAEMATYAATAGGRAPAGESKVVVTPTTGGLPLTVTASLGTGSEVREQIALGTFVWSPDEYAGLARSLLEAAGVRAMALSEPPGGGTDLLLSLTDLRPAVIERANHRVSSALASAFADPANHDAAALVLSAFALREAAGMYSDARMSLCRMAAHLAFAQGLRQGAPPTAAGRYARATLLVLAGRGADAAVTLEALAADTESGPRAWRSALRRRLLEDTRADTNPQSLLERRELYRALLLTLDSASALDFGARLNLEPTTDRWRLASEWLTVEAGNVLLSDAIDRELDEVRTVWQLARDGALGDAGLVAALNEPAERCIGPAGPRVLGWGTWAAFLQRHLINALWSVDRHRRYMLGLDGDADVRLRAVEGRFGGLVLYPLIETRCEMEARRRPKRYDDLITLMVQRPELVNAFQWWSLAEAARYEVIRRGPPELAAWFSPGTPRGTTFDVVGRRDAALLPRDVAGLQAYHALSPQDWQVTFSLIDRQYRDKGPSQEIARLFGPRVEYDMRAVNRLALSAARDTAALGPVLDRKCALSPSHCFEYGAYLVETGQLAAAAVAYQRAVDLAADHVAATHHSRWLVNHYLDRGEAARARAVATEAGGTGSGSGLVTLSRFLERTGDYEGAEELLRRRLDRYGNRPRTPEEQAESQDGEQDGDELAAFYHRMSHVWKRPGYDQRFREASRDAFGAGLERADVTGFSGYPADGVFVLKTWAFAERNGVKVGDIIVAADGYRVRSRRQYALVRRFSDDPAMSVVVFRHPGYVELKLRSASRYLEVDMRTHKVAG